MNDPGHSWAAEWDLSRRYNFNHGSLGFTPKAVLARKEVLDRRLNAGREEFIREGGFKDIENARKVLRSREDVDDAGDHPHRRERRHTGPQLEKTSMARTVHQYRDECYYERKHVWFGDCWTLLLNGPRRYRKTTSSDRLDKVIVGVNFALDGKLTDLFRVQIAGSNQRLRLSDFLDSYRFVRKNSIGGIFVTVDTTWLIDVEESDVEESDVALDPYIFFELETDAVNCALHREQLRFVY